MITKEIFGVAKPKNQDHATKLYTEFSNCTSLRNLCSARVDKVHNAKDTLSISSEKLLSTEISSKYMLTIPSDKVITKSSSMETPWIINRPLS